MAKRTLHPPALIAAAALLACLLALLAASEEAGAAFPGKNGRIVFTDRDGGDAEIYAVDPDGSDRVKLTSNAVDDYTPAWSPDGTKVAFASERGDCSEWGCAPAVYVMDADGSDERRVSEDGGGSPAWSPDGTRIAFSAWQDDDGECDHEDPDGPGCRDGDSEIYTVDADGSNKTRVTDNARYVGDYAPDWSPDGTGLAFVRNGSIYVAAPDGTDEARLTELSGSASAPDWSPDGARITFHATLDYHQDVYSVRADGSEVTNLTPGPDVHDTGFLPAWSPDGTKIAFSSGGIFAMNPDGSGRTRLTESGADPDWGTHPATPPADATGPAIARPRPAPGSETRDRTPTVAATVRDAEGGLAKSDVRLYLDGRRRSFSYDPATDRLSRTTGRLSHGRHTVRVTAEDAAGNTATRGWSFRVVGGR